MPTQCTFEDSIASTKEWEKYRDNWSAALANAKQPKPTAEQMDSVREIWLEGFLAGRMSK